MFLSDYTRSKVFGSGIYHALILIITYTTVNNSNNGITDKAVNAIDNMFILPL